MVDPTNPNSYIRECVSGPCYWYNNTITGGTDGEKGIKYCMPNYTSCNETFPYLDSETLECRSNCVNGKFLYNNVC